MLQKWKTNVSEMSLCSPFDLDAYIITFMIDNMMTPEQQAAYQQLLKKRSETLRKTTNDTAKR